MLINNAMKKTARITFILICLLLAVVTGYSEPTLHESATGGNLAGVKRHLEKGADIDARDKNGGSTPLICAARAGHVDIIKFLVARGADGNKHSWHGNNPLMWAVFNNQSNMVKLLVSNGVDIEATNRSGVTALLIAIQYDRQDIVEFLKKQGTKKSTSEIKSN